MIKYNRYSLALNDKENEQFKKTGLGIKAIFRAMLNALVPPSEIEEITGDGKNKSGIMRNFDKIEDEE